MGIPYISTVVGKIQVRIFHHHTESKAKCLYILGRRVGKWAFSMAAPTSRRSFKGWKNKEEPRRQRNSTFFLLFFRRILRLNSSTFDTNWKCVTLKIRAPGSRPLPILAIKHWPIDNFFCAFFFYFCTRVKLLYIALDYTFVQFLQKKYTYLTILPFFLGVKWQWNMNNKYWQLGLNSIGASLIFRYFGRQKR